MKGGVFNRQKFKIEESPIQKIKNSKTRKTPKFIKDKIFDEILKRRLDVLDISDAKDRQKAKAIHMSRIQKWFQKIEEKIDEELITDFDNWCSIRKGRLFVLHISKRDCRVFFRRNHDKNDQ
jgi:hypothetical protein